MIDVLVIRDCGECRSTIGSATVPPCSPPAGRPRRARRRRTWSAFTQTEGTLTMDDGVSITTTLYTPDGEVPVGGRRSVRERDAPRRDGGDGPRPRRHSGAEEVEERARAVRVLAITHGPSVGPGVFADAVRAAGDELVERQLPIEGVPSAEEDADAVIVLGGAMHPDEEQRHGWLRPELRYLERQLERGTPMLGVCLGSQLIARAAGARVFRADEPEVGWLQVDVTEAGASDPVTSALPSRFDAFQWHHYTHDLPDGAVELARSPVCLQAYRLGRAWGVQFHPEVRAGQVESWLAEDPDDVADPAALRAETRGRIAAWNKLGRRLCSAFLATV